MSGQVQDRMDAEATAVDYVILDLRDERGRFFCRPKITREMFDALCGIAMLDRISFEELLHRAIQEHAEAHPT